jgi:hypothetical protein
MKIHNLCRIQIIPQLRHRVRIKERENVKFIFFSRRHGRRWENNIKMSNEKWGVILSTGIIWLVTRSIDSLCEHSSGSSGHEQSREFHASYAEEYCEDEEEGKCNAELNC